MTFNNIVLQNILRDKWTYIAYFLSSVFSIFIFFSFSVSMFHPDLAVVENGSALSMAMMTGNILIYLFSFVFISFSVMSFMNIKQKTLGLFVIMGASKQQLKKMIFRENMLIGIGAIITAIVLGLAFAPLFLMVTKKVMSVEGFAMYFPSKAIILTFLMFFLLFLIISLISSFFIRKQRIIQLLKSDQVIEKEVRYSPIVLFLGIISVGFSLSLMTIWHDVSFIRPLLESNIGAIFLFIIFVLSLYFLYMHLSLLIIHSIQKQDRYLRKTNMLTISGMKSKIRTNVKIMYLVSLLLMGTFFSIVMLYSANVNVEGNTKANYPYSFMYVSKADNPNEREHVQLLQHSLEKEKGYEFSQFDVLYNAEDHGQAFISQSNYNKAIKSIDGQTVSLNKDSIYIVSGLPKEAPDLSISPQFQKIFYTANIKPQIEGSSKQNILPAGYFNRLFVISDYNYLKMSQMQLFSRMNVFAYNIDDWKRNTETTKSLKDNIKFSDRGDYGFFSAGDLYIVEKNSKNLMFYVGFMLSLIFVIAALSMIYFRLITDLDKEREKYKSILKMGLSKKELSAIVSQQLFVLMFVPFIVASLFFFIGVVSLQNVIGGSLKNVAIYCFSIFFIIQLLGYYTVNTKYRKALMKGLANFNLYE